MLLPERERGKNWNRCSLSVPSLARAAAIYVRSDRERQNEKKKKKLSTALCLRPKSSDNHKFKIKDGESK